LPALLFNLFWKRFNTSGAIWSIYGGLVSAVVLVIFSPVVSGKPTSMITGADFAWFPLSNPGIVSIPLGFVLGVVGTYLGRDKSSETRYDELSVRALTGAGAEGPSKH
ncbi:MAG TPA: cation acetate symporter, partial [Kribbella sp.]|nr:cation acetate symporter [Kribbella sp.]